VEALRIPLQIVRHLVLGRLALRVAGQRQAREGAVGPGGKQLQGVVAVPPGIPATRIRIVAGIGKIGVFEEVPRDQPGLASPDNPDLTMIDHMARIIRCSFVVRGLTPHRAAS
jgi:hypothetical protein